MQAVYQTEGYIKLANSSLSQLLRTNKKNCYTLKYKVVKCIVVMDVEGNLSWSV
jgi:hypothetical protein